MNAAVELTERVDDGDKDKKKNRKPNRRSKQNASSSSSISESCSSVNKIPKGASECLSNGRTDGLEMTGLNYSSSEQQEFNIPPQDDRVLTKETEVSFSSLPIMRIDEQLESLKIQNRQNKHLSLSNVGGRLVSTSCLEPISCGGKSRPPPYQIEDYHQRKYFPPHWSMEALNEAVQKGDAFKALLRVNAHNRLEAYCTIDGVPIDVLISGIASQNRAMEGDLVVVTIDPLSLWAKLKGPIDNCNNSSSVEDNNLVLEDDKMGRQNCKGKSMVDTNGDYDDLVRNSESSHNRWCNENKKVLDEILHGEVLSSISENEVSETVVRLCAMINSFPSKRPTGRVVGIIERSPRRDNVVGSLNVKQLLSYRECYGNKIKNKGMSSFSNNQYIHLIPSDQRFPKMVVFVHDLPDSIKKRLDHGDAEIESELVAARVYDWSEYSSAPLALISHFFGQASGMESQIDAVLFENAIPSGEFSEDALSCLPKATWQIPQEEFQRRRDLRNLCVFTIDPSTATDLDDALSVEKLDNGMYRIGIHIADISYFVLPDTSLDVEAMFRSTSVYLPQYKLPMLPPFLSEDIGSLNPGVDKLTFSMFFDINRAGYVLDRWIGRTVICSCCKLSYDHAQDVIDGLVDSDNSKLRNGYCPQLHGQYKWSDVIASVKTLNEVSKVLKDKRFSSGALQLETPKVYFLFDDYRIPYDSKLSEQKESNFLVEEFMLLANSTAAEVISRAFPDNALLRRHPEPNSRKLREFEAFCSKHGLELSSSGQFHQSLELIRQKLKGDSFLLDILMSYASKPMQMANYFCTGELKDNEKEWSHFALAVPLYTHFTSPIRRYPDILVHRMLTAAIEAEEFFLKHQKSLQKAKRGESERRGCFTGVQFDRHAAESIEAREALSAAAQRHRVPCTESLSKVASHCNDRKLASRCVKDACDKLCMWALLRKKEILLSNARVMGLGPRFMSVYIHKFGIERRIHYNDVEGLTVEWLETTSTLVLSFYPNRHTNKRGGGPSRWRPIEDFALLVTPLEGSPNTEIEPAVFPHTLPLLSTIPVALHAVGGDDGPLNIGVRLYMSSYFK